MPNGLANECHLNTGKPNLRNTRQMHAISFSYVLVWYLNVWSSTLDIATDHLKSELQYWNVSSIQMVGFQIPTVWWCQTCPFFEIHLNTENKGPAFRWFRYSYPLAWIFERAFDEKINLEMMLWTSGLAARRRNSSSSSGVNLRSREARPVPSVSTSIPMTRM